MANQVWSELEINNARWQIPNRYSNLTPLGQGAYGLVWYENFQYFIVNQRYE